MDGYRAVQGRYGGFFLFGGRQGSSGEWGEDVDKGISFGGFREGLRVVAGSEAAGPWRGPDLEEVDPVVGFVLFGVRDACEWVGC